MSSGFYTQDSRLNINIYSPFSPNTIVMTRKKNKRSSFSQEEVERKGMKKHQTGKTDEFLENWEQTVRVHRNKPQAKKHGTLGSLSVGRYCQDSSLAEQNQDSARTRPHLRAGSKKHQWAARVAFPPIRTRPLQPIRTRTFFFSVARPLPSRLVGQCKYWYWCCGSL